MRYVGRYPAGSLVRAVMHAEQSPEVLIAVQRQTQPCQQTAHGIGTAALVRGAEAGARPLQGVPHLNKPSEMAVMSPSTPSGEVDFDVRVM